MPLTLATSQTIVLGHFNPHIITPEWLVKHDILKDAELSVKFIPLSQGISFTFGSVTWRVDFSHLLVESLNKDCGDIVKKVIRLLPHTPVRAVGHNFHYALDRTNSVSVLSLIKGTDIEKLAQFGEVEQAKWTGTFHIDGVRTQVSYADIDAGTAVHFNFHRETPLMDDAQQAAAKFGADKLLSERMLRVLFPNEEVTCPAN